VPRDSFDPTREQQNEILIDEAILNEAARLIESCEHCNSEGGDPFDAILDRVTVSDPSVTGLHCGVAGEVSKLPA
jgi:hypothetical protein